MSVSVQKHHVYRRICANDLVPFLAYVMKAYPAATRPVIRKAISQKIKDERAAGKRRAELDKSTSEQFIEGQTH